MNPPTNRLPSWFRQEIPQRITLKRMELVSELKVNTVCKEARCPNIGNCFNNGKLTFMILGNICTRDCKFCGVNKSKTKNLSLDEDEPDRIIQIVKEFNLKYVVITSVTRDDLADGGAGQFVRIIRAIHGLNHNIIIEILIPDFQGNILSLESILEAEPDVIAHNLETVFRLYSAIRPQADYRLSLEVLSNLKLLRASSITPMPALTVNLGAGLGENKPRDLMAVRQLSLPGSRATEAISKTGLLRPFRAGNDGCWTASLSRRVFTKSSIILGLGEREEEVIATMEDLRKSNCDILTLGQYLAPSDKHYPVYEFISPEQFMKYRSIAISLGFKAVLSAPLVRSSYKAEEVFKEASCV